MGASRFSLVEIYVSQSDAGQMSDGCFLVVFLINEGLLGKIRTTKRHDLERTTWEMAT